MRLLGRHFHIGGGGDWEWMWTTDLPSVVEGEASVVELDARGGGPEIHALLVAASPRTSLYPTDSRAYVWLGVRSRDAGLVACGAAERTAAGTPHLAGVATHPDHRGRGYGEAVTAALTRRAVRTEGVCTLGMYSHNDVARRLYERLGYHNDHAWSSRLLVRF